MIRAVPLVLFLFFAFLSSFSQDIQTIVKANRIETEDGVKYYVHKVEKGQTLYSISKAYEVSVDDIIKLNPETKDGLRIGQEIWIEFPKEENKKQEKAKEEGDFVYHIVKKGETLYSISKIYCVEIEKIKEANPGSAAGLKEGDYLKIPLTFDYPENITVKKDSQTVIAPSTDFKLGNAVSHTDTVDYIIHKVKKGETVYSIAREYNLSVEDIYALNPGSENGVKKKQELRIPVKPLRHEEVTPITDTLEEEGKKIIEEEIIPEMMTFCDSINFDNECNIAVMLPLYLEDVDSIHVSGDTEIMPPQFYKSFRFLPFYQGFLLAVDSLKKTGLKAKVYVYDVTSDIYKTERILEKPEMKDMDLIIGLMYSNSFNVVSQYAKEHGIRLVHPISNRGEILDANPHVYKVKSSLDTQLNQLAQYIIKHHKGENIVLVYNTDANQKERLNKLEAAFNKYLEQTGEEFNYYALPCDRGEVKYIKGHLNEDTANILITFSDNQAFVINYLRQIHTLIDSFNLVVYGMPSWETFKSLETHYLLDLNLHLFSNTFVDYSDDDVKVFIREFRERFENEPDDFAFQGFDIGYYFITALRKFGKYFEKCLPSYRVNSLQTEYYFKQVNDGGYENTYLNVYMYKDYKLVDARREIEIIENSVDE